MIAFDFDGPLFDFTKVSDIIAAEYGYYRGKPDTIYRTYYYDSNGQEAHRDMYDRIFKFAHMRIDSKYIVHGAREVLQRVYELTGDPIYIVTARPIFTANDTLSAAELIMGKIPHIVVFSVAGMRKHMYLKNHTHFVEDRRKTAIQLAAIDKTMFLLDKTYNQIDLADYRNFPDLAEAMKRNIIRIKNMTDIIPYLPNIINYRKAA